MKVLLLLAVAIFSGLALADNSGHLRDHDLNFEISNLENTVNLDYHKVVDNLVWDNAFLWSNASSGQVNPVVLAMMSIQLTTQLSGITTPSFRQCDRLNSICYFCENGAADTAAASVTFMAVAKLFGQDNNMMSTRFSQDASNEDKFYLQHNTNTPVFVASLACQATPGCYPSNYAQTVQHSLQGTRKLTFLRSFSQHEVSILIDRINTGARYTYGSSAEGGIRILQTIAGPELVPDSIMDNTALVGPFCLPSSQAISLKDKLLVNQLKQMKKTIQDAAKELEY